ncbi:MAG TPA: surface-adhesin E family protein [Burkholderiales bacterium]|nr:surface-adhesin E family protein [Burkholderiales bacterium]
MRALAVTLLVLTVSVPAAVAETWIEVGADPEAKFYIDVDSITMINGSLQVIKRGLYTRQFTENFDGNGKATVFKETRGTVEIDCELRVNRVRRIDMLDEYGALVWSSGDMPRQLWLSVKPNSHAEATLDVACAYYDRA